VIVPHATRAGDALAVTGALAEVAGAFIAALAVALSVTLGAALADALATADGSAFTCGAASSL